MKNIILICLSLLTFISCNEGRNRIDNTKDLYGVISTMTNYITSEKMISYALPVPPPVKGANLDSLIELRKKQDTSKIIKELIRKNGKLIVAIDSVLSSPKLPANNEIYLKDCLDLGFKEDYNAFKNLNNTISINISRILNNNYSFIIPYRHHYKSLPRKGFEKFNIFLKFSNISFNENHNKAVIIMGVSFGRLNGFSGIYFLEKKNSKWIIKCKKGLTIS